MVLSEVRQMGSKCGKGNSLYVPALDDFSSSNCSQKCFSEGSSLPSQEHHANRSDKRRVTGRGRFVTHSTSEISSEYDVGDQAGEGTQGVVFRATRKKTGVVRAIKKVPKKSVCMDKFRFEIELMKRLDHPNIIKLYETFDDRSSTYLVMELCSGGELFDKVVEQGSLSESEAALVLQEILRAVHYMHEQDLTHRDLKPENFIFASKGPIDEENMLKLIDFGVACECRPSEVLKEVVGTPYYVAPQVITLRYDKMCDLWSCGVIMFTLLTGNVPFCGNSDAETLSMVREGIVRYTQDAWRKVSEDALYLVKRLLTRNPKERWSAQQALECDWIKKRAPMAEAVLQNDIIDRLGSFRRKNRLKQAVLTIVANEMDNEQIRHLRETFTALDTNGDGLLTYSEIKAGLEKDGLDVPPEMGVLLGRDKNAEVDYTEFLAASLDLRSNLSDEAIRVAFGVFDVSGNGTITNRELARAFGDGHCKTSYETIVDRYSAKGDGAMDFDDFRNMMQNDFSPPSRAQEKCTILAGTQR